MKHFISFLCWVAFTALSMFSCNNDKLDADAIITGDDIQSFNVTTREIAFQSDFLNIIEGASSLNLVINKKNLFGTIQFYNPVSSFRPTGVVIYTDFDRKNFLLKIPDDSQKWKTDWDIFIKYLNDAGKISEDVLVTGDDIQSFNVTTKEIIFQNDLVNKMKGASALKLSINEKQLFETIPVSGTWQSSLFRYFVMLYKDIEDDKFYLRNSYVPQNWETDWDIFFKYLSDAGKIVELKADVLVTGDDILYFDVTTEEITFNMGILDKLKDVSALSVVINEKPLFGAIPVSRSWSSDHSTGPLCDFVVLYINKTKYRFYLRSNRYDPKKWRTDWITFQYYLIETGKFVE